MQEFLEQLIPKSGSIFIFELFVVILAIQLFYWLVFYSRFLFIKKHNKAGNTTSNQGVSVIICAKNESENLQKHLPLFLKQNYKNFEVIVVNDCSTDDSLAVLYGLREEYKNLYITNIEPDTKFSHGKKLAQTIGIKAAKNEILLFSDADCCPVSEDWISSMVEQTDEKTDFILGYGAYKKTKGLLNKIIRYDAFFIGMQYLSFAKAGIPYMGVGRNLLYKKSVWLKNKGFAGHLHVLSGDDDLFVNKNANRKNTKIEVSATGITESEPNRTFTKYIFQKKRHLTTGKYYKLKHKLLLGTEILSRMLFYLLFTLTIALQILPVWVLGLYLLRLIIQLIITGKAANILNEKKIFVFIPILDIFTILLNIYLYFAGMFSTKKVKWR